MMMMPKECFVVVVEFACVMDGCDDLGRGNQWEKEEEERNIENTRRGCDSFLSTPRGLSVQQLCRVGVQF